MTPGLTPEDQVCITADLQRWEQSNNVQQFKPGAGCSDMLRWNSTLRWHAVHLRGCIAGRGQAASRQLADAVTLTQPAVPEARASTGRAVAMLDLDSIQTSDAAPFADANQVLQATIDLASTARDRA